MFLAVFLVRARPLFQFPSAAAGLSFLPPTNNINSQSGSGTQMEDLYFSGHFFGRLKPMSKAFSTSGALLFLL